MSSPADHELDELEVDFRELLEAEETPPQAFYRALRNALAQLEHHAASAPV